MMRPQRKRKTKTKDSDESEYECEEENDCSESGDARDDDDDNHYNASGSDKSGDDDDGDAEQEAVVSADQAKSTDMDQQSSSMPISRRVKMRKKKSYDVTSAKDLLPSYARRTEHGGYAHTNQSKNKISKANSGNTPWNKGRNRSSADRAKIAAGVRARNRAILLEKLKRLGMSEEEWIAKKREIKYLRERIRRAKLSNAKHQKSEEKAKTEEVEKKLKAAIEATTEKKGQGGKTRRTKASPIDEEIQPEEEDSKPSEASSQDQDIEAATSAFSKDVQWTPFSFGEDVGDDYTRACPSGGPGGLVCCESCAEKYTMYLSGTIKDMEVHRTSRNSREVKELLKFLQQGRETLKNAYDVAKKKIPPLPPKPISQKTAPRHASSKNDPQASDLSQWNMTSAIDLAPENANVLL